jgi:hypothetical protein
MNNFRCSLEKTFNGILYDFTSINSEDILYKSTADFENNVVRTRKKIADSLTWTQVRMKSHYDRKHQSLNMKIEDFALLRLHKEYNISISKILERKLSQQYAKSFRILEKIESLVYRLNISQHWRIHSVISITQLESALNSIMNLYNKSRSNKSKSVYMKENTENVKSFEMKRLINKRNIAREIEYLLRWKDYDSEWNEWRNLDELQNFLDLIEDYENSMNNIITLLERLSRINFIINIRVIDQSSLNFKDLNSRQSIKSNLNRSSRSLSFDKITNNSLNIFSFDFADKSSNDQTLSIKRFIRKKKSSREREDIF